MPPSYLRGTPVIAYIALQPAESHSEVAQIPESPSLFPNQNPNFVTVVKSS